MKNFNKIDVEKILGICDFINSKLCINLADYYKGDDLLENGARTKFIEVIYYDELDLDYLYLDEYYGIKKQTNHKGDTKRFLVNWCGVINNTFETAKIMFSCDDFGGYTISVLNNNYVKSFVSSTIFYEWFINYMKN